MVLQLTSIFYQEAFLGMDDVEEAKEKVKSDMKKWLKNDRPDLHEAGTVQSCKMSQIWQIYLCKDIGRLG